MQHGRPSRRQLLQIGAAVGGSLLAGQKTSALETNPRKLGEPLGPYSERSPFEKAVRWRRESKTPETGSSFTPLHDSVGSVTPSALHYERHHSGIPTIDPARHRLVIHGMVDRPLSVSMTDIRRLPSVTRLLVLECGGNSAGEWAASGADVQRSYGLVSGSEWTGVALSRLLAEAGVQPRASWVIAEGADACRMMRSMPLAKALESSMLAYGQNGEAMRPSQGYPLRLINPGWEGNTNVKWLHSLKLTDQPYMARDETSKYSDLMPDGKARIFTYAMEAKSVITFPSGGQTLPAHGLYELTGLAWSGRGRIDRVEVTTDGGRTWVQAALQEPQLPIALTRFRLAWRFDGQDALIASRAIDETDYVQPSSRGIRRVLGKEPGQQIPVLRKSRPMFAQPASLGLCHRLAAECVLTRKSPTAPAAVARRQAPPPLRLRSCARGPDARVQRRNRDHSEGREVWLHERAILNRDRSIAKPPACSGDLILLVAPRAGRAGSRMRT